MQDNQQEAKYQSCLEAWDAEWESRCGRCGACCGGYDDPCRELKKDAEGKYFCGVYSGRYGFHETVGGKRFLCMPIRDIIHMSWDHDQLCAYKKDIKP